MISRESVVRLGECVLLAAWAAVLPAMALAQWWGPFGGPMGAPGLPRPPSVGEFMSNPRGNAPVVPRGMTDLSYG